MFRSQTMLNFVLFFSIKHRLNIKKDITLEMDIIELCYGSILIKLYCDNIYFNSKY
jgi:hypothetical protein